MELKRNPPAPRRRLPRSSFFTKKLLSTGGAGAVYRVGTAHGYVALKVFNRRRNKRDSLRECDRERKMLKKIAEYETNRWNGRTLQISHIRKDYPTEVPDQLMLEYIAGEDLTEAEFKVDSIQGKVDIILRMMHQIRDNVLQDLHSVNIYHNDIKPANILSVPGTESSVDPTFYLIDFGLAVNGLMVDDAKVQDQWSWCTLPFVSPHLFQIHWMGAGMRKEEVYEAAMKADYYSLALTAIDSIEWHCGRNSVDNKDPLCKMVQGLVKLREDWWQHAADFRKWPLKDLKVLLVPFWNAVAQQIANFRKQDPELYPKVMRLLAEWTSCDGFPVCQLIDFYDQRSAFIPNWKGLISKGGNGKVYRVGTANKDAVIKVFDQAEDPQDDTYDCAYERAMLELIAWYETNRWNGETLQISHIRNDYPEVVPHQLMLEYKAGKDLTKADFGDSSMPKLVDIMHSMMQQISDNVLEGLHSVNIYHNDIKPANILSVPGTESSVDPMFYLIDFGHAVDGYAVDDPQVQDRWKWSTFNYVSPYLFEILTGTRMREEEIFEAAKKADYYSLALTAIDCIKRHCDRHEVDDKDPLCKMARELVALQAHWGKLVQKCVFEWDTPKRGRLFVPFWEAVAQQISNFRKQDPYLYPEFMDLLAQWTNSFELVEKIAKASFGCEKLQGWSWFKRITLVQCRGEFNDNFEKVDGTGMETGEVPDTGEFHTPIAKWYVTDSLQNRRESAQIEEDHVQSILRILEEQDARHRSNERAFN